MPATFTSLFSSRLKKAPLGTALLCLALLAPLAYAQPRPDQARALKSSDKKQRHEALEKLRRREGRADAQALRDAAKAEKDPVLKIRALQALAASDDPSAVADLLAALSSEPDPMVRQAAAQQLGNFVQDPAVVTALASGLDKDRSAEVRGACALGLALSDTPAAAAALEKAAGDPDPALRRQSAFSLGRHKSPRARAAVEKLRSDPDPSVRESAGGPR